MSAGSTNVRAQGAAVFVNEVPVVEFRTYLGRFTPSDQATRLASSLESILEEGPADGALTIAKHRGRFSIRRGALEITKVTPAEAKAHGVLPGKLAHVWLAAIAKADALPGLQLGKSDLVLAVGTSRTVSLVGSMVPKCVVKTTNPQIIEALHTDEGISVSAVSVGRADVEVSDGIHEEILGVEVRPWAARFPQTLSAFVSGAPASVETVRGAVLGAARTQFTALPGATWVAKAAHVSPLPPGDTSHYLVRVRASAHEAFDRTGDVDVVVKNLGLPQDSDEDLWYSNSPESITRAGPLFSASLRSERPARLLYHHVNASPEGMYVRLQAINDSDVTARLFVIPGDSEPDGNPVRAGLRAADQFVRNWMCGSGEVVAIPPRSTIPLSLRRLAPGETVSGLCSLRLVSGPAQIQVRTDAWPPFRLDPKWVTAIASSTPWREVGSHPINEFDRAPSQPSEHIYPDPYRRESFDYHVGGRYGFFRIGQSPIARLDNEQRLEGNFGVIYRIKVGMSNPTTQPVDVELVFEASAGCAAGLFILDGRYLTTPILQPKQEARIGRFHLEPGSKIAVSLTTLPVSGGSYPATLMVRPVQLGDRATSTSAGTYRTTDGTEFQNDRRSVPGPHLGHWASKRKYAEAARGNRR